MHKIFFCIRDSFASFKEFDNTFSVLHFREKIIQLMDGKTEGTLAIAFSSRRNLSGQFTAFQSLWWYRRYNGKTCEQNSNQLWIAQQSLVFDIITSNIDHWKYIWAHFRTTIALISSYTRAIIKYARITIHRETKGLDDPLFKQLKRFFGFIGLDKRAL